MIKKKTLHRYLSAHDRFWLQVKKTRGCWHWQGSSKGHKGYGRLRVQNVHVPAHRFSYQLHIGPIPTGLVVCHKCDKPLCVNPRHLFLGTIGDNVRDAVKKGRMNIGVKNGRSKLTPSQVREIREKRLAGVSGLVLAKEFKVTNALIYRIAKRKAWRHV